MSSTPCSLSSALNKHDVSFNVENVVNAFRKVRNVQSHLPEVVSFFWRSKIKTIEVNHNRILKAARLRKRRCRNVLDSCRRDAECHKLEKKLVQADTMIKSFPFLHAFLGPF